MAKDKKDVRREEDNDEKLHLTADIFELKKQSDEAERKRQEEREKLLEKRRKKAAEERDKRLEAERLELIRLKQGVIEESETIHEEQEEEIKLSLWGKIKNFFYHNKWWLGIGTFATVFAVWMIVTIITRPRPDVIVLVLGHNNAIGNDSSLSEYIEEFTDDTNGNGKILASVYYIPYTGDDAVDYANGVQTKLTAELQSADTCIILCNNKVDDLFDTDYSLVDLTEIFPDNPQISRYKFMLKGTDFAEKIGIPEEELTDDWFLAIRRPTALAYSSEKKMQKTYDKDYPVFERMIEDLSK